MSVNSKSIICVQWEVNAETDIYNIINSLLKRTSTGVYWPEDAPNQDRIFAGPNSSLGEEISRKIYAINYLEEMYYE